MTRALEPPPVEMEARCPHCSGAVAARVRVARDLATLVFAISAVSRPAAWARPLDARLREGARHFARLTRLRLRRGRGRRRPGVRP